MRYTITVNQTGKPTRAERKNLKAVFQAGLEYLGANPKDYGIIVLSADTGNEATADTESMEVYPDGSYILMVNFPADDMPDMSNEDDLDMLEDIAEGFARPHGLDFENSVAIVPYAGVGLQIEAISNPDFCPIV